MHLLRPRSSDSIQLGSGGNVPCKCGTSSAANTEIRRLTQIMCFMLRKCGGWCVQPRLFSFVSPLCLSSYKAYSCIQLMKSKENDERIWSWRARVPSSELGGYIWLPSTGVQAIKLLNVFNDCTFCFKALFRRNVQKSFKPGWCNFLMLNSLICWGNLLICEKWARTKLYEDRLGWQQCWDCLFLSTQIRQVYAVMEPEVMEWLSKAF